MEPLRGWEPPPWSLTPKADALHQALYLLLLGSLPCALAMAPCKEEEYPVGSECCPKCSPGYRVKEACGELTGTLCVPCDPGTYTAHLNGLSECLQCRVCDPEGGQRLRNTLLAGPSRALGARHPEPVTWTPEPGANTAGATGARPASPSPPVLGDWTLSPPQRAVPRTQSLTPHPRAPTRGPALGPGLLPARWSGVEGPREERQDAGEGGSGFGSSQVGVRGLEPRAHPQILGALKKVPLLSG
ncbi:tumor necrosis factor receptor superfamily member 14 isoform X3 [Ailuropoda melanoleuca]|uniref:tumor necrosis factor receptor superfamily member 14 isoform X3 n=1 Tax=Ailuropoda melanoleuca TaxID=9646 RepID=UPI001494D34F|nr:tumor necrosis factor receptor superfamily member 14 isoform X3 [Ailuropoda melanoleuca]